MRRKIIQHNSKKRGFQHDFWVLIRRQANERIHCYILMMIMMLVREDEQWRRKEGYDLCGR